MTARKGRRLREVGVESWAPLGVLALLFVLGSPGFASTPVVPAILTQHAPILIEGDNNFTAPNGVTAGTGGAADPYVIQGWLIDATSSNGITIRQTRAHLVIRNLTIEANFPNYWGIFFDFASNATVQNVSTPTLSLADNDISSNGWVGASFEGATDGSIVRNRFSGNGHTIPGHGSGLSLASSVRFQVDHNDFLSNEFQANDTQPGMNAWHAAYPRGGNHWSDYTGVDQCSGPAQNLFTGPDGFGDTPYLINGSAHDRWGNEVRDPSSGDYQVQVHSISEPIGGGPAGMDANALGFLVAVPAGIFGALLLVAWVLRSRKH